MLRHLYDRMLAAAEGPRASWALALVAFAESSFFPVPPDVMLVPMSLARPDRAWFYAGLCTAASVLGGLVGYAIGALAFDTIGRWVIDLYGLAGKAEGLRATYAAYGHWFILLKGLTPIPYKLVTIVSGLAGYSLPMFIGLSLVTRGARFYLLALVLNRYGTPIRAFIEAHTGAVLAGLAAIVIGGFLIVGVMAR